MINLVQDVQSVNINKLDHWTGVGNILTIAFHVFSMGKPQKNVVFPCFLFFPRFKF